MPVMQEKNSRKARRKQKSPLPAFSDVSLRGENRTRESVLQSEPEKRRIVFKKTNRTMIKTPYAAIICENSNSALHMSLDNMLSASHALSICQNGRVLNLDKYPEAVRRYVTSAVKSGNVDGKLKELNKQIVCEIGKEAQ